MESGRYTSMKINSAIFKRNPCFKVLLSFAGSSCLLFYQMEEENGEDEGGGDGSQAFTMRESGWCDILVIVMIML